MRTLFLSIILLPLFTRGQAVSRIHAIDSVIFTIEEDPTIVKKVYDTVSYQKEDGGNNWDSAYNHREVFYKDGQIVKIRSWNSYGNWRNDMLSYYQDKKPIRFSKGESFEGQPEYGLFNFQIYYYDDKDIQVSWLTPKPANVLGVATDVYLQWAYSLLKEAR